MVRRGSIDATNTATISDFGVVQRQHLLYMIFDDDLCRCLSVSCSDCPRMHARWYDANQSTVAIPAT